MIFLFCIANPAKTPLFQARGLSDYTPMDKKFAKLDNAQMARLDDTSAFDADAYPAEVVGLCTALSNHDSGSHSHRRAQLLYARQGSIRITLEGRLCLLPPGRAAWIPSDTIHRAVMTNIVDYRSVYFRCDIAASMPKDVRVLSISPLLFEVLEAISSVDFDQAWHSGRHAHLLGLSIAEICAAPCEPTLLPLPSDRRLVRLFADPERLPPELNILEKEIGASGKTITRIFQKQTGMSYQQWRQQWRVLRAIELLSSGRSISTTAAELDFSSDSVFISFFRKIIGKTPYSYMQAKLFRQKRDTRTLLCNPKTALDSPRSPSVPHE